MRAGLDPIATDESGLDLDMDGLTNLEEQNAGTDLARSDSDGDRLTDAEEVALGTDPLAFDSDGGGSTDGEELLDHGTDPLDAGDDFGEVSLPVVVFDGAGFRWDVQNDGRILDGTSDAFDTGLNLVISQDDFNVSFDSFQHRHRRPGTATAAGGPVARRLSVSSTSR